MTLLGRMEALTVASVEINEEKGNIDRHGLWTLEG